MFSEKAEKENACKSSSCLPRNTPTPELIVSHPKELWQCLLSMQQHHNSDHQCISKQDASLCRFLPVLQRHCSRSADRNPNSNMSDNDSIPGTLYLTFISYFSSSSLKFHRMKQALGNIPTSKITQRDKTKQKHSAAMP